MLSVDRLDKLIRRARLLMLAGFAVVVLARATGFGAAIAIHLIGFGAGLRCMESCRNERGIWMLALMFGGVFFTLAVLFDIHLLIDAIRGAAQPQWAVVLDCAIVLQLQWFMVRAFISASVHNRRLAV
jgi:hypothetical protein